MIWDIQPYLDEWLPSAANITIQEPAAKSVTKQEINHAALDFI